MSPDKREEDGMNKQTLAVIVGAIVLLGAGIFGAMAFTGSDDSNTPIMTMPDGSTMPADQMSSTDGTNTMEDGETMPGMEMTTP
jgi:hypothetical protein